MLALRSKHPISWLDLQCLPNRTCLGILAEVRLLTPVEEQEVWAVGVTYLRSKKARMEESDFSATAYDRVYDAPRPELFFKSLPEKVVGPGESVGIRSDAKWSVPEPELAFVINSGGNIVGFTIGNDMSSRDIEGENLFTFPKPRFMKDPAPSDRWWSSVRTKLRPGAGKFISSSSGKARAFSRVKPPSGKSNEPLTS